jgi:phosphoglycolate phosphatase-like HAD superfamily hydrolase
MTDAIPRQQTAFLFDLDGTLVDSVYQHVLAWREALDSEGIELAVWRIHRKIGMSGGLLTNRLLGETGLEFSPELIERLQRRHAIAYNRTSREIRPGQAPGRSWPRSQRRRYRGRSRRAAGWKPRARSWRRSVST